MEGYLNPDLIKWQGLTEEEVQEIVKLHEVRECVFGVMEETNDPADLRILAGVVEDLEFKLQDAWKFPRNRDWHCWWYRVPKCICPKLDNTERQGTKYRIYSGNCPVHSGFLKEP
jgi:hypothetical protein